MTEINAKDNLVESHENVDLIKKSATATLNPKEESIDNGRITCWLILSVLAAGLGSSFIFGYNIGVINVAGNKIKRWIGENCGFKVANDNLTLPYSDKDYLKYLPESEKNTLTFIWSLVGGFFPLGAMFGGLSTGFVADRFGRKGGMLINNLLTFVAGFLMFISKKADSYHILLLGRFLIGVNCGLNSGLAPMYLTEIAPVNYRGLFGSVNQLMVTISILVSNLLGFENMLGTADLWPYLLAFTIVPSIWQLLSMPFCPESPKYLLITKGQHDTARNALVKLRQTSDVDNEINAMQREADKLKSTPSVTYGTMFNDTLLRWALFLAVMMMLSQQLSGINATMFYSTIIFEENANLSSDDSRLATLGVMVVNVLMTVVSTIIVDRAGRRTLQLAGLGGMFISTIALVISLDMSARKYNWAAFASIVFVITFVVSFATGPGSIPWFYVSELFEQNMRGKANSIAVGVNWFATFLVGFCFPPIQLALQQYTFLIFTAFLAFFWLFTYKFIPETKNRTVEKVHEKLRRFVGPH